MIGTVYFFKRFYYRTKLRISQPTNQPTNSNMHNYPHPGKVQYRMIRYMKPQLLPYIPEYSRRAQRCTRNCTSTVQYRTVPIPRCNKVFLTIPDGSGRYDNKLTSSIPSNAEYHITYFESVVENSHNFHT